MAGAGDDSNSFKLEIIFREHSKLTENSSDCFRRYLYVFLFCLCYLQRTWLSLGYDSRGINGNKILCVWERVCGGGVVCVSICVCVCLHVRTHRHTQKRQYNGRSKNASCENCPSSAVCCVSLHFQCFTTFLLELLQNPLQKTLRLGDTLEDKLGAGKKILSFLFLLFLLSTWVEILTRKGGFLYKTQNWRNLRRCWIPLSDKSLWIFRRAFYKESSTEKFIGER